ncbi:hypothetical protein DID88_000660 [Monilinia fructigena]|uniref:Methionine aminopeptidase n=1 Tax=Monilinia fructigena TaxID=38457 RepID=A0A395IJG2_9HELO|nr:hypothetical protein DID88_000660 [Monilinia fructigena]
MVTEDSTSTRKCIGVDCENEAGSLQCPTCLKLGTKDSFFCSQDCFKKSWSEHKKVHNPGLFNPFPTFPFTGALRPVYPLSDRREVPKTIQHPDYWRDGVPRSERTSQRNKFEILNKEQQEGMRKSYPSPLNYCDFPKSVCTSVNEVICHGIPDRRVLKDGDILNIDVTLYHEGFHGDLNETYYIGDKAKADPDAVRVVEAARECLDEAIKIVKPGVLFRDFGNVIEKRAKESNCSVIKSYCGHGINSLFHCAPNIPHYAKNKAVGAAKPGMCFTIEPMIALGTHRDKTWPDNWTSVTQDGKKTAQFEHTLLITDDGCEILTGRFT